MTQPRLDEYFDDENGEWDCPEHVPPEECVPMTPTERQSLWFDIQDGIKWYEPDCAAIGDAMQDFANYGDLRKYDGPSIYAAFWTPATINRAARIAIRSDRLASRNPRMWDYMHEGVHEFYGVGNAAHNSVWGTYWVDDNCFNH